jgi:hypothetical protein
MSTLRAEKTTRNQDDYKVLMIGMVFSIFLMLVTPLAHRQWDVFVSDRPFVSATIEVVQRGNGEPYILYDADATQAVDGIWSASMIDENGFQIVTRAGEGHYNSNEDGPRPWSWYAFFDNDKGLNSPGVPNVPFKVCVRYIVDARDSGVHDESPTYCSALFTPRS